MATEMPALAAMIRFGLSLSCVTSFCFSHIYIPARSPSYVREALHCLSWLRSRPWVDSTSKRWRA
jgi:hypothetical protein